MHTEFSGCCAFVILVVMLMTVPPLQAQELKPLAAQDKYHTKSGVVYTQGVNGPLVADAYIPNGSGPFPGILFIHGGGWINGNRYQMAKMIKDLASQGYVGFTIEYDVDPVHYPASFDQSRAALRYFREHAADFNLDATRVAVAGSSAGGELAALVALDQDTKVQGAVILNGVLDLTALGDKNNMVTQYLGGPCSTMDEMCRDASPISHIHLGAPAFFVGHGTADETVPFVQADAFVTALRAAKVPVRFFTAKDGPHTYWMKEQFYSANLDGIKNFLSLTLRQHKESIDIQR